MSTLSFSKIDFAFATMFSTKKEEKKRVCQFNKKIQNVKQIIRTFQFRFKYVFFHLSKMRYFGRCLWIRFAETQFLYLSRWEVSSIHDSNYICLVHKPSTLVQVLSNILEIHLIVIFCFFVRKLGASLCKNPFLQSIQATVRMTGTNLA